MGRVAVPRPPAATPQRHRATDLPTESYVVSPRSVGANMSSTFRTERNRGIKEYRQKLVKTFGRSRSMMGWSHPYTLGVLSRWKLAPAYCQAVLCHHRPPYPRRDRDSFFQSWCRQRTNVLRRRNCAGPPQVAQSFAAF
jgi:hypothetical protein